MTYESVGLYQRLLAQAAFLPIWALIFWGMRFTNKYCAKVGTVGLCLVVFFAILWWFTVVLTVSTESYIEWKEGRLK